MSGGVISAPSASESASAYCASLQGTDDLDDDFEICSEPPFPPTARSPAPSPAHPSASDDLSIDSFLTVSSDPEHISATRTTPNSPQAMQPYPGQPPPMMMYPPYSGYPPPPSAYPSYPDHGYPSYVLFFFFPLFLCSSFFYFFFLTFFLGM